MIPKITRLDKFNKDLKKLSKRFRTLEEDINIFVKYAIPNFFINNIDNQTFVRISALGIEYPEIYKVKKFACRCLKGGIQSGIRLIIAYHRMENQIDFIEIYYKGDKSLEDQDRILKEYKQSN